MQYRDWNKPRFLLVLTMVLFGGILRLVPHPWNFTPIGAMALFSGATFPRRWTAFLVPMLTLLVGDALLELVTGHGFHSGMPVVYGCFGLTVCLGSWVRSRRSSIGSVAAAATGSATIFYLITNFWVWTVSTLYPKTFAGLISCYVAGLPFYGNNLAADWIYSALLFGSFVWVERRFPIFREQELPVR